MYLFRRNNGICLLALALALVPGGRRLGPNRPPPCTCATNPYRQAVDLLDQADQQLTDGNLSVALSLVKQSNALFTRLQKDSAAKLAERELSDKESQQLAINQKLATEAQGQGG